MSKRFRIDFNNTIVNAFEARRRILSEGTRRKLTAEDAINGSFKHHFSEEFYFMRMGELFGSDRFLVLAEPFPGACETLANIMEEGQSLKIVSTARGLTVERVSRWFRYYGLSVPEIVTAQKDKTEQYSDSDYIIDDEYRHLEPHILNPDVTLIQFEGYLPRAAASPVPPPVIPAYGWGELRDLLCVRPSQSAAA